MQTVPCPQGDGTCTIPDPAVVAVDGRLTILPRVDVVRMLSERQIDQIDADALRLLPSSHSAEELTTLARGQGEQALGVAREVLRGTASTSSVIVHCTCGHLYVLDI